jgi:hypothetical protein
LVFKQGGGTVNFVRTAPPEFNTNVNNVTDEALDKYLGIYLNDQIQIKITIIKACNNLFAHATGRNSLMLLEAKAENQFEFAEEGIIFEFLPSDKTVVVKQNRRILNFVINE